MSPGRMAATGHMRRGRHWAVTHIPQFSLIWLGSEPGSGQDLWDHLVGVIRPCGRPGGPHDPHRRWHRFGNALHLPPFFFLPRDPPPPMLPPTVWGCLGLGACLWPAGSTALCLEGEHLLRCAPYQLICEHLLGRAPYPLLSTVTPSPTGAHPHPLSCPESPACSTNPPPSLLW